MVDKKTDYNNVPVEYCKTCLSLNVRFAKLGLSSASPDAPKTEVTYCGACSNAEIGTTHITEWEDMYESKYGKKFLDNERAEEEDA